MKPTLATEPQNPRTTELESCDIVTSISVDFTFLELVLIKKTLKENNKTRITLVMNYNQVTLSVPKIKKKTLVNC